MPIVGIEMKNNSNNEFEIASVSRTLIEMGFDDELWWDPTDVTVLVDSLKWELKL